MRFVAVWGAFAVLTLFYLIPIIAIQGLINIDQLRKIHVIAVIIDLPVVRSIITAILPGTVSISALTGASLIYISGFCSGQFCQDCVTRQSKEDGCEK